MSALEDAEQGAWEELSYISQANELLSDSQLIDACIAVGTDLNKIVPNNRFPAYDVARRLSTYKKAPTQKQRDALVNVLSFYETFGVLEYR